MELTKPMTTRRVIKPSASTAAKPAIPVPAQTSAPSPALQPRVAMHPLWRSWLNRFNELERLLIAAEAGERHGWTNAPRLPNAGEMQRIQASFLEPWTDLMETFDAASSTASLSEAQTKAWLGYLELRATWYRALMKRFLVPSEQAIRLVAETGARVDAALAARRR